MTTAIEESGTDSVASMPALEVMQRAEIDVQISTAKRFPRSLDVFGKRATAMATVDEETAESCIYRRPVGKENGRPVYAEGLSVRMAEIVAACYGNLRVYSILTDQSDRQVKARGVAIDLETNFASSSEVVESTVDRHGRPYSERQRVVIAKAALAKARRDATFQVVPKCLANPVEKAVRKLLVGDAKSLDQRRKLAAAWVTKLGINPARVYLTLGVNSEADLTAEHLEILTGIKTAIKDGDTSIDEAFPDPEFVHSLAPAPEAATSPQPKTDAQTIQQQIADAVIAFGGDFDAFRKWSKESGSIAHSEDMASFDDIPNDAAKVILRGLTGRNKQMLIEQILRMKGQLI